MNQQVFKYLKSYSTNPIEVDRLIVSVFLSTRDIKNIKNKHISNLLIKECDKDFKQFQSFINIQPISNFEQLIELFEFVISPEEKIINGAVYTPKYIREYIVEKSFKSSTNRIGTLSICDPACGCAGFLLTTAKFIKEKTSNSYREIFANQLFGLDIEDYSIERSKLLLTLLAISEGEDETEFKFNLHQGNALSFEWAKYTKGFQGFDIVLGNPPYVCSRNMDEDSLELMENWTVTQSGHPDLYIPFFQIGFENLKPNGILGYITVNTFIKSVNGRALREYFSNHRIDLKIINFGGEQVFRNRSTYTCICFLRKAVGNVQYKKTLSNKLDSLTNTMFIEFEYESLHDHDGWNLVDSEEQLKYVNQIEAVGRPFKEVYTTRNGIATLKNDLYKFYPIKEDGSYYFLKTKNGLVYKIEKDICRDIVNPNKARSQEEISMNSEKIIFPYIRKGGETFILEEEVFIKSFPNAYKYLSDNKQVLAKRDKGKREYEKWYAYGRRQSLDINSYKLFFPHLSERPSFTISRDKQLLFYSGIAVISDSLRELRVLKRIMESDVFFHYIKNITKDYSSGYISMSKNYIKNFGIYELTEGEKDALLETNDPESFLKKLYGLSIQYEIAENKLARVAEPNDLNYG